MTFHVEPNKRPTAVFWLHNQIALFLFESFRESEFMALNLKSTLKRYFSAAVFFLTWDQRMTFLLITFCCFSAVHVEASGVLEVSGHVGADVSIHCFVTAENSSELSSMYFCKGLCSSENAIIQTEGKKSAVIQRGRYRIQFGEGVFNVTIRRLRRTDAGRYRCGSRSLDGSHQEVNLNVVDASSVPPPSPKTNLMMDEVTRSSFPSNAEAPVTSTLLPSKSKKSQQEANDLTDTVMVIIVSGSLAFLVCTIIPLIFYRHWRSNAGQNRPTAVKAEDDCCEVAASTQVSVGLQSLEQEDHPESSAGDNLQYVTIYEGLDPKTID